ncbi:DEAD/DEAH box helicase family protein [Cellulophaga sp. HaHa_2_95]|uniref:DEAD/DEAH box helicase n=1 Tax=Cellulophaga sp. HaHa_2_95 TaxID=2745558 RepID=UPI001C4F8D80|nr:DEAD/DEAH box helicase family protein [Cellulophaga sp. HaHa_2_95]QXP54574.1 DEAD/DEAH box helicase family protein [Cellulophaga sp. HaHa_2_95]
MSFFIKNKDQFKLEVDQDEIGFRKCQLGAIWAVKSHYTKSNAPALISMPTGSGKTALMIAICFELKIKKVLIITPSVVIRKQIFDVFSGMEILKTLGVYKNEVKPNVNNHIGYLKNENDWIEATKLYDVVVSTPHSCSSEMKENIAPPKDLFDLIIIDEAHHTPAKIYRSVFKDYSDSKIILLTATPFRRDRKRIPGDLIYHYPMAKAIKDEIYRPVTFKNVDTKNGESQEKDSLLADAAIENLRKEQEKNPNAQLLIKTKKIDSAEELKILYEAKGISVGLIHSGNTTKQNEDCLIKCKKGELESLIAVGMIGEGLDIPTLKISVLHDIPRTLPTTIQFIGRISRIHKEQIGNAILIADKNYVKGEVKKLYYFDKSWDLLIPELVDKIVTNSPLFPDLESSELNPLGLSPDDLKPFFSTKIYKTKVGFEFIKGFHKKMPSGIELVFTHQDDVNSPLILITKHKKTLPWGKDLALFQDNYDLHILYLIDDFLFESTTSDLVLNYMKSKLFDTKKYEIIPASYIRNGLSDNTIGQYFMVGMSNIYGSGASNPSYKMLMGLEVESAVKHSDGSVFSFGHALSRIDENETRGIAVNNGRIWAIKRKNLREFSFWCQHIHSLIKLGNNESKIPRMSNLADFKTVEIFEDNPVSVLFDNVIFQIAIVKIIKGDKDYEGFTPEILFEKLSEEKKKIECALFVKKDELAKIHFNFDDEKKWVVTSDKDIHIIMDIPFKDPINISFEDFINDYPPLIIFQNAKTLKGSTLFAPKIKEQKFDIDLFKNIENGWDDTDVTKEAKPPKRGKKYNVQQKTIKVITDNPDYSDNDIVVIDDGAGEMADIIWFSEKKKTIHFFHCKFSYTDNPGADMRNITELFQQAMRNCIWIRSSFIIKQLLYRVTNTQNSTILDNKLDELNDLHNDFIPTDWDYKVYLVQPGLSKSAVFNDKMTNAEKLLLILHDRLSSSGCNLSIWASE